MAPELAIDGGKPTRIKLLPYGRQWIDDDDIAAVVEVLRSDWLTTGPKVAMFEDAFTSQVGAKYAVAVSNGTAALHAAVFAVGIGQGDEVIVTPMTFAASANCVLFQGGTVVFADVRQDTLSLNPASVEAAVTPRTRAIITVDYTGQPSDLDELNAIAKRHRLILIEDAAHALGADYRGRRVGTLAHLTTFSLHPVKHITTGEGGIITTDSPELAARLRIFRNHGITVDHRQRETTGSWFYEMADLGYNYRLTDFQCALGLSQLKKLPAWLVRRREIAARYNEAFAALQEIESPTVLGDRQPAWHLYVIRLNLNRLRIGRADVFKALRAENIGVNVHYIPVPWHPYYQKLGYGKGLWPVAEAAYERLISLPIFPGMSDSDVKDVVRAVFKVVDHYAKRRN
jgi:perosamine synthetase